MMSSLSASLMPSARRLQQAERADPVGAEPLLHPGDDAALAPDRRAASARPGTTKISDGLDQRPATTGRGRSRRRVVGGRTPGLRDRAGHAHCGAPMRRAPRQRRRRPSARDRAAGELVGSQTTPSGMSVTASRQRDRAARRCAPSPGRPSAAPMLGGRGGGQPGDRPARGAGQVRLAVLQPAGVEQLLPGGQHRLARRRASAAAAGGTAAAPGARAVPRRRARRARRAPRRRVRQPEVDAQLVGEQVAAPGGRAARRGVAQRRLERPRPALPVRRRCRPSRRPAPPAGRRRRAR